MNIYYVTGTYLLWSKAPKRQEFVRAVFAKDIETAIADIKYAYRDAEIAKVTLHISDVLYVEYKAIPVEE